MYIYGRQEDIRRLIEACKIGGVHLYKLNKMPEGHLTSIEDAEICDIDAEVASTITARYFKGLGAHKDNMVMEIFKVNE